jgi:glycosyltransferase involved in cell wall biosynthesis
LPLDRGNPGIIIQPLNFAPMMLSVVIPVYNEAETLPELHQRLHKALDCQPEPCWEVIYVDDGSSDGSVEVLESIIASDMQHSRVVEFRRNFGQTAAIAAGIDHAQGDVVVLMDADLQNDPADIPMMVEKINEATMWSAAGA